tara:strand:+ start:667 stop:873 length:207 start_codon:yes stop_codon:yes gene_type:complete
MCEMEYLIIYEDMDKHYIVFKKNGETRVVEPVMRFVNKHQAYNYFDKMGLSLIKPEDADWGGEDPNLF